MEDPRSEQRIDQFVLDLDVKNVVFTRGQNLRGEGGGDACFVYGKVGKISSSSNIKCMRQLSSSLVRCDFPLRLFRRPHSHPKRMVILE